MCRSDCCSVSAVATGFEWETGTRGDQKNKHIGFREEDERQSMQRERMIIEQSRDTGRVKMQKDSI